MPIRFFKINKGQAEEEPRVTAAPVAQKNGADAARVAGAHVAGGNHSAASIREDLEVLEQRLGYVFKDRAALKRAITHRSVQPTVIPTTAAVTAGDTAATNSAGSASTDYERLEFLGDAVLDLATAHHLLESFPQAREGDLSKMRAALVNTTALAMIAREIQLGEFIRLSRAELSAGGNDRDSILADVVEALMGAVYREAGFDTACALAARLLGDRIRSVTPSDPKTELQEQLHALGKPSPEYLVEFTEGPEHSPIYVSIVRIGKEIVGRGRGKTKKESQQAAAAEALVVFRSQAVEEKTPSHKDADANSNGNLNDQRAHQEPASKAASDTTASIGESGAQTAGTGANE